MTDARTDRPLGGVCVTAASRSTSLIARTRNDGHFHFMDLPDGEYSLTPSLPSFGYRYDTAEVNATLFHDVKGNIKEVKDNSIASTGTGVLIIKLKT